MLLGMWLTCQYRPQTKSRPVDLTSFEKAILGGFGGIYRARLLVLVENHGATANTTKAPHELPLCDFS